MAMQAPSATADPRPAAASASTLRHPTRAHHARSPRDPWNGPTARALTASTGRRSRAEISTRAEWDEAPCRRARSSVAPPGWISRSPTLDWPRPRARSSIARRRARSSTIRSAPTSSVEPSLARDRSRSTTRGSTSPRSSTTSASSRRTKIAPGPSRSLRGARCASSFVITASTPRGSVRSSTRSSSTCRCARDGRRAPRSVSSRSAPGPTRPAAADAHSGRPRGRSPGRGHATASIACSRSWSRSRSAALRRRSIS